MSPTAPDPAPPLSTVRVPPGMAPLFARAEEVVSRYFRERRDRPDQGTIEIFGERYVLVRAASLSVEFFALVRSLYGAERLPEADAFARNILFDLAHAVGKADARNFHAKMGLTDPIARLSAGPIHFSHAGWAFVDIFPESRPSPDRDYFLIYDHPYSFESDAWLRGGVPVDFPVCIMNSGYSSGWCEESFGITLVASELLCRARGDQSCRFIMAPPERIEEHVERYIAQKPDLAARLRGHQVPDFFARKRMEEELRRKHDELEQRVSERTAELVRANELLRREMAERQEVEARLRQKQKLEALGRLAGGVAHDFNNILTVVTGHAALTLARLPPDDPLRRSVVEIRRAADRAATLTRQLLAFSRHQVASPQVLDVGAVVAEISDMLRRLIGEDVESVASARATGRVRIDRSRLEQVIVNLVVNARDAMPRGGRLTIETSDLEGAAAPARAACRPGRHVLLSIGDTGSGMSAEVQAHLFEPFFTTKEMGKGTGLGLAIVYAVVQQAGGAIWVESALGRGTTVHVALPRIEPEEAPPPIRPADAPAAPRGAVILLVEDEDLVRDIVRDTLVDAGHTVIAAPRPEDALAVAARDPRRIDILLTDVVMPGMGGRELAEKVLSLRPGTRVIYMSGYTDDAVVARGVLEASVAFLQKPFTPEELGRRIREVLEGGRADPPAPSVRPGASPPPSV